MAATSRASRRECDIAMRTMQAASSALEMIHRRHHTEALSGSLSARALAG